VQIIVLKANGRNFSAGADLDWMKRMVHFSEQENLVDALELANLLKVLHQSPKVTIALAHGNVIGGGIGLLACCDLVISDANSRFCFSEAKLGLIPATIAPYIIQAMGSRAAKYYFLTAKPFSAIDAKNSGLVHEIAEPEQLLTAGMRLAASLLKNGPEAIKLIKQLVADVNPIDGALINRTAALIAEVRVSPEAQEGLGAFLEKREPSWLQSIDEMES
jgi:methylglutaconyl-CoA hydratase